MVQYEGRLRRKGWPYFLRPFKILRPCTNEIYVLTVPQHPDGFRIIITRDSVIRIQKSQKPAFGRARTVIPCVCQSFVFRIEDTNVPGVPVVLQFLNACPVIASVVHNDDLPWTVVYGAQRGYRLPNVFAHIIKRNDDRQQLFCFYTDGLRRNSCGHGWPYEGILITYIRTENCVIDRFHLLLLNRFKTVAAAH